MIDWLQLLFNLIGIGIVGTIIGIILQHSLNKKISKFNLINESQFKAFNELWKSLMDLKRKADELWDIANDTNLLNFVDSIKETDKIIEFNGLILNEEDYNNLKEILNVFSEFKVGKNRLIEMDKGKIKTEHREGRLDSGAIYIYDERENQVYTNSNSKSKYEILIQNLKKKFQDKMGIK